MNLALFDFDGTITSRETFGAFIRFAAPRRRRVLGAPFFAPLVAGYRLGLLSGSEIRARVVHFGFRGLHADELGRAGQRFAEEILPATVRPTALARIRWHRSQGDKVLVVSGALDVYLSPWCKQHGLDLICSRLHVEKGLLSGRFLGSQCVNAEKSRRVRELCVPEHFPIIYAYGDTKEDLDMLAMAHRKFYRWQEIT
ncbi:HAD family hydrolase [Dyella acidisoli]|uniref:Hydrolase n=1 Tax=Dyella acidisoli TaxID=1867834 RepID=A0ABQ5XS24_9GAMM|nr:HAD family hydrolase [Dyella acidisoli]GLQ93366.1 hydrolase [Dyella acidisoli]